MKSGGTPNTSRDDFYGGDIPFVTIEDMTNSNKHLASTKKTLTSKGLKHSNAWLVPVNSILYSIYATLGVPRINTVTVATNQAIIALINDPKIIHRDYLYYWLEFIRPSIVNFSSQTTQSNLSATTIKTFLVDHPVLIAEQSKIADILSTVDRAIEQTEALIAKHQRIKAGLMQDLLTRGIDEEGNIRTEETHEFKDSPLGRIPVEWEIKRISEIGSIFTGTTPSTFNQTFWNGEIVWVTPHDLSKLTTPYLVNSAKKIAAKGLKSYSLNLLPAGSIIISSRAPIGYIAISKMSFCTNQGCKSIKLKEEFIPEFIYYNMALNINWIKQLGEGTTFAEISKDALSAIKLAVPTSKYEQTEISNIIRTVDLGIEHWQNNYRKLRSLKTALMQDLLTGKVRVTPLLNETEVAGDERGSSHPADSA